MESIIIYIALGLIFIFIVVVLAKVVALERGDGASESISKAMADIAERIAKSSGDIQLELTGRIGERFDKVRTHLDEQLSQNRQELQKGLSATTESLNKRLDDIRSKVDERLDTIGKNVQAKLDENMKESFGHFEKFQKYMKDAEEQLKNVGAVGESINDLNKLLKLPHLRGEFGEATLELLLSEFLPKDMYELQAKVGDGYVDCLVKFPSVSIPIDSKFPREQVMQLFESGDEGSLKEARKKLDQAIRIQANKITKYICPEAGTTDMALMFLPSETLYFEVVRNVDLWNALSKIKVYPVSPNTLAITLKSIALAHENYQYARGVEKTIESLHLAKKHFGYFQNQFLKVGLNLDKAQEAFKTAGTHLDRYSSSIYRLTGEEPAAVEAGDAPEQEEV